MGNHSVFNNRKSFIGNSSIPYSFRLMKTINYGVTRTVFEFNSVVVKLPKLTMDFAHFLKGMVANIQESRTYKFHRNTETGRMLCPVLFAMWGGWFLVMKKADVEKHEWEVRSQSTDILECRKENESRYKKWIEHGVGGDDKCDNYGYLNGVLVKIDYANSCMNWNL